MLCDYVGQLSMLEKLLEVFKHTVKDQAALKHSYVRNPKLALAESSCGDTMKLHGKQTEREIPGQFQDVSAPLLELHPLCSCNYMRNPEPE